LLFGRAKGGMLVCSQNLARELSSETFADDNSAADMADYLASAFSGSATGNGG
jgi:hypothetical protein